MPMFSGVRWYIFSALALLAAAAWIFASRAEPGSTTNGNIPLPRQGFAAPDFSLNTPDGQSISLSELRGRPVLVNLWTSWCPPCRAEMPAMQNAYEAYHDQGFEIFGVSLDENKQKWEKAIVDDRLTWYHVSDLRGWESKGAKLYGVRSIPHTVLIDDKGKIIAKNLRGDDLRKKIKELLQY